MTQRLLVASFVLFLTPTVALATVQATFYLAPDGNDSNPGIETKPFATIEKARQAVRAINQQMSDDIVVVLSGGVYQIDHAIVFAPEDSGANGHNVIYRAAPNESPVISGGKPIIGWKPDEKGRWKAPAPLENFRQLYVNGKRATRARGEAPAHLELSGDDGYTTTAIDMADWKNPSDLEFCYLCSWAHTRCKVQSIRREGDRAVITMRQPYFTHAKTKEGTDIVKVVDECYIENALELVDQPGEWYLNWATKTVFYLPKPGEDMTKVEVIAPAVETLVALRGTLDKPVEHIRFEGITFRHGNWLRPSEIGHVDVQANMIVDSHRKDSFTRPGGFNNPHCEFLKSAANVVCHAAKSIRFDRCTFTQLGGAGLDIEFGSQNNIVSGCRFFDIAGSGIQIGDVRKDDHHPDDSRKLVKGNTVENCYIHDCCKDYLGGVGVFVGYTDGTVITHNEITQVPYSAISIGWGWGETDAGGNPAYEQPFRYDTPTPAKNNRIQFNHIHHAMDKMFDGAGVYTLGNMPGTVIRGNHIHDNHGLEKADRGPVCGIYLDEGSGFIEITGNLVHDVNRPINYNNLVQNRKATCNEHDNFFDGKPGEHPAIVEEAGLKPEYRNVLSQPE